MIGKLLLLLSVGCLAFAPLQNHKAEEDAQTIEGNWIAVSAELGGDKLPGEYLKDVRLILTEGRYTFQIDQGLYKLVPAEEPNAPKAMDITGVAGPNKGKTFLAIYEVRVGPRINHLPDHAHPDPAFSGSPACDKFGL